MFDEINGMPLHPLIMHRFHPLPPDRPAELRARLRSVLEGAAAGESTRDAALASLAGASGLLDSGRGASRGDSAALGAAARAVDATAAGEVLSVVESALLAATARRPEPQGTFA